jgi:uncharacterized protein (DUF362 family)
MKSRDPKHLNTPEQKPIETEERRANLNRRRFLAGLGRGAAGLALGGAVLPSLPFLAQSGWSQTAAADAVSTKTAAAGPGAASPAAAGTYDLATVTGDDIYENVRRVIDAIGGMKRFVSKGDVVVVKPNIGWDRAPEMAANTNPTVVAALVAMAFDAGAAKVKVFDHTCNNPKSAYMHSGIQTAAEEIGAQVIPFDKARCKNVKIPNAEFLTEWPVFPDVLECDCVIDCPIAKVHGGSKLTLGIKNLMGVVGGNRGHWHKKLHVALAEFLGAVKPQLTVIDAWRILTQNGPQGGSLEYVKTPKTCIASADIVAADARATALFDMKPQDIDHIVRAAKMGYGQMDLSKVKKVELT